MFGFIKNLIGGIFGFIGGFFGKKDEFYLELKEEVGQVQPVATKPVAAAPKVEPVQAVKAEPVQAAKPAKPAKATKAEPAKAAKVEPAKAAKPAAPAETNFATKYLITPSSGVRRRPGANMNSFLDMARQVKVPG
jgi:hypothetical protein